MQLLQPDEESCRSEILHARVYDLELSKGIARAEIFFAGLKKNRVRTDGGRTLVAYSILIQVLQAFGIRKSRSYHPYHPQGDGMVERFNIMSLQLLRVYVTSQSEWKTYLPQVLAMCLSDSMSRQYKSFSILAVVW